MKTLKTTILSLSLILLTSVFVQATEPNVNKKGTMGYTLDRYIEWTTKGIHKNAPALLDDSFKLFVSYGGKTMSYNKKQVINHLKKEKSLVLNCDTRYEVVEECDTFSIIKMEMDFPTFTKINHITMDNKGGDWVITSVYTTYN